MFVFDFIFCNVSIKRMWSNFINDIIWSRVNNENNLISRNLSTKKQSEFTVYLQKHGLKKIMIKYNKCKKILPPHQTAIP